MYDAAILSLGNTGTGAAFHHHGESWLFLVSGRKRWFLYPSNVEPVGGFWPGYSSKDWFEAIYPLLLRKYESLHQYEGAHPRPPRSSIYYRNINGTNTKIADSDMDRGSIFRADFEEKALFKPLECMQSEGQILYLPEFWWHSVLNLGNLVISGSFQAMMPNLQSACFREKHGELRRLRKDIGSASEKGEWTELEKEGKRLELVQLYRRLSAMEPINAVHHFFMGQESWSRGPVAFNEAIAHFTDALLMDPTFVMAYDAMSNIYAWNHPQNEHFYDAAKAEELLLIASILNPNHNAIRKKLRFVQSMKEQSRT